MSSALVEAALGRDIPSLLAPGRPRHPKRRLDGTHRVVAPEETLERVRPYLPRMGITRLADITGLDTIGIPVTLAVRPNGRVLSVSSGKGLTTTSALVSGMMESLELHHAEVEWSPPSLRRSYAEMRREYVVPAKQDLPLAKAAPFPEHWPYEWTWGWDLIGQQSAALPVSMIHMGNRSTRIHDLFSFQITSNGLASGNTAAEAVTTGLLEVIERDAIACHTEAWRHGAVPPLVELSAVEYPTVRALTARLDDADIVVLLFDCSVDTGVPVYWANIVDPHQLVPGTFSGYGAHLDPEIAMTRAITEAVQARTVTVAGSRDDIYRHREALRRAHSGSDEGWRSTAASAPSAPAPPPSYAGSTFEADTETLLDRLKSAGLERAIVVDLSTQWCPATVVKVVVPGLEGYRFENYEPGRRARSFVSARGGVWS